MAPEQPEADWVEVQARASLCGLHYGQVAIVDRSDAQVRGHIRAGHLVVLTPDAEAER